MTTGPIDGKHWKKLSNLLALAAKYDLEPQLRGKPYAQDVFKSSFVDPGSSMRAQFSINVTQGQSEGGGLFADIQMHPNQLLLSNTKGTLRLVAGV